MGAEEFGAQAWAAGTGVPALAALQDTLERGDQPADRTAAGRLLLGFCTPSDPDAANGPGKVERAGILATFHRIAAAMRRAWRCRQAALGLRP